MENYCQCESSMLHCVSRQGGRLHMLSERQSHFLYLTDAIARSYSLSTTALFMTTFMTKIENNIKII
jgi:hypothetical protein